MNVTVVLSARWGFGSAGQVPPAHLAVEVGGRTVPACTGGAVDRARQLPFDQVLAELHCGPCRKFWNRVVEVARDADACSPGRERPSSPPADASDPALPDARYAGCPQGHRHDYDTARPQGAHQTRCAFNRASWICASACWRARACQAKAATWAGATGLADRPGQLPDAASTSGSYRYILIRQELPVTTLEGA